MHDTFYLSTETVRTHTSPVQIHALEKYEMPLKNFAQEKSIEVIQIQHILLCSIK